MNPRDVGYVLATSSNCSALHLVFMLLKKTRIQSDRIQYYSHVLNWAAYDLWITR